MIHRMVVALVAIAASPALGQAPVSGPVQPAPLAGIFVRANVGLDVIGGGLGFGAGVGYRFEAGAGAAEAIVDVFHASSHETGNDGVYQYVWNDEFTAVALRFNWLPGYPGGRPGLFAVLGSGFFAAGYSYTDRGYHIATGTPYSEGNDYTASGAVLNVGGGYAFGGGVEVRLEAPVMIFFGTESRASAVAIPIQASLGYRF